MSSARLWRATISASLALMALSPRAGAEDPVDPNPLAITSIAITSPASELVVGSSVQLSVRGTFADGSERDITADPSTVYEPAPDSVASVSAGGNVQGLTRGLVQITVGHHQGFFGGSATAAIELTVRLADDADNDGLPDAYELANGLDPNNSADASADSDDDGLSTLAEFTAGTDPRRTDGDGDGLPDGLEIAQGTDPLDPDSPPRAAPAGRVGRELHGQPAEPDDAGQPQRNVLLRQHPRGRRSFPSQGRLPAAGRYDRGRPVVVLPADAGQHVARRRRVELRRRRPDPRLAPGRGLAHHARDSGSDDPAHGDRRSCRTAPRSRWGRKRWERPTPPATR